MYLCEYHYSYSIHFLFLLRFPPFTFHTSLHPVSSYWTIFNHPCKEIHLWICCSWSCFYRLTFNVLLMGPLRLWFQLLPYFFHTLSPSPSLSLSPIVSPSVVHFQFIHHCFIIMLPNFVFCLLPLAGNASNHWILVWSEKTQFACPTIPCRDLSSSSSIIYAFPCSSFSPECPHLLLDLKLEEKLGTFVLNGSNSKQKYKNKQVNINT